MNEQTVELCLKIAKKSHGDQKRRGGGLYVEHPIRVANSFEYDNFSCRCVALLHDVLEDTETTFDDLISQGVPLDIACSVKDLTKNENEDYYIYLDRVKRNYTSLHVKIADIVDNLTDKPTHKQIEKYRKALVYLSMK
jgi:(p)ppGpp synthase/HD superfamily hydrolase